MCSSDLAELLVKGLEGIKTTLPVGIKVLGVPARLLRTMITRTPTYVVNQIVKDSTAMWLYSGADIKPVLSATKELGSMLTGKNLTEKKLQAAGIEGGQLFTGMPEDMGRAMLQIMGGRTKLQDLFVKADRLAMKGDAATRVAMYNAYVAKGMSPVRAKLAVLEALNFNKRGLSPTIHMLSTLVPFMNTQIQGLDVLAKSFTGKLTLGQQKDLRAKLWRRGTALAAFTVAYAALMNDDEAYKNADPWTKYTSWFIRLPFFDEPIKVPAPFEFGYIFKALPEAIVMLAQKDTQGKPVLDAMGKMLADAMPLGPTSFIPQAVKPILEARLNKSFYTGEDIESKTELGLLPEARTREKTTGAATAIGDSLGVSPVKVDYLANAYFGGYGMALMSMLGAVVPATKGPEAPTKRLSDMPLVGSMFQPTNARGQLDAFYDNGEHYKQIKNTFDALIESGKTKEAEAFADKYGREIVLSSVSEKFKERIADFSKMERLVRASSLTPNEKRLQIGRAHV